MLTLKLTFLFDWKVFWFSNQRFIILPLKLLIYFYLQYIKITNIKLINYVEFRGKSLVIIQTH